MTNVWRVLVYEYLRHVRRKRFILMVLSMPLILLAIFAVAFLSVMLQFNSAPIGYVDQSGLISQAGRAGERFSTAEIVPFKDMAAASTALKAGDIQAYYVIRPDYLDTGTVDLVANKRPGENVDSEFSSFMRDNLIRSQPAAIAQRLEQGDQVEVLSLNGERQMGPGQWMQLVLPFLVGFLFIIVINMSGGYLLQAVVEEKENRTIEIVVTSVSPGQLMGGKIIGNLAVGLTQILIWVSFPLVALLLFRNLIPWVDQIRMEPSALLLMTLTLIPAFVLVAALMATIGATATESREAQQIAGFFTLPIAAPFWFTNSLISNPNGPISVTLSLFPLTAPVALPLRSAFTVVPVWQMALSVGMLWLFAAVALWLAGRAFRLGMLRYGKRLSWKELFGRG